jgi:hypothetical protein
LKYLLVDQHAIPKKAPGHSFGKALFGVTDKYLWLINIGD